MAVGKCIELYGPSINKSLRLYDDSRALNATPQEKPAKSVSLQGLIMNLWLIVYFITDKEYPDDNKKDTDNYGYSPRPNFIYTITNSDSDTIFRAAQEL